MDKIRDFPVNLSPYVPADEFEEGEDSPDFFTKIELGKKLVLDAFEKGIQFREALFDNWYLCKDFVSFMKDQRKDWISTLKSNDIIYRLSKRRRIKKKEEIPNKEEREGIYCRKVSQFSHTELFSGNNKGLQRWQGRRKIYLGSKF